MVVEGEINILLHSILFYTGLHTLLRALVFLMSLTGSIPIIAEGRTWEYYKCYCGHYLGGSITHISEGVTHYYY